MSDSPVQRRLTAILAADVVGYTRLMSQDEAGTHAMLRLHRERIFDPEITSRGGRIVKLMGDGTLVEFPSVVDAVEAAIAIQRALDQGEGNLKLRIGVNLGDVIIDGDDIYGDGVNIAVRLESLAIPGGVCISSIVRESIGNRIDARFDDAGEHKVKNLDVPIGVFRWPGKGEKGRSRHGLVPVEAMQDHTIFVMQFENLSNDEEMGYFCDGITQAIITAFGSIEQLTVVSDDHRVKEEKAHYALSGKIQKSGSRIRVSTQLIDRESGIQRWAGRFDREITDLFDVQDEVTRKIVIAIHTELGAGSYTNRWQWGTENFEAWQLMARGFNEFQKFSPASFLRAVSLAEKAVEIDLDYLAPLMLCGYCYAHLALVADPDEAEGYLQRAEDIFERSVHAAPDDVRPYAVKRAIEIARGNVEAAVTAAQTALDMEPGDSYCRAALAGSLLVARRPNEALSQLSAAAREVPDLPGWACMTRMICHYMLDDFRQALDEGRRIVARMPNFYSGPGLSAIMAVELGLVEEAEQMRAKMLELDPQFSARQFVNWQWVGSPELQEKMLSALKAAGLPD